MQHGRRALCTLGKPACDFRGTLADQLNKGIPGAWTGSPAAISQQRMASTSPPLLAKHVEIVKEDVGAGAGNYTVPTLEEARKLPRAMCELDNVTLFILAEQGCNEACYERLIREIMAVDGVEWFEAAKTAKKMQEVNRAVLSWTTLPYKIGISVGVVSAFGCYPMIFHVGCAKWFNRNFVTMEVPVKEDIETWLEVGAWTWNWMEPVLGTVSFTLLALQLVRNQMLNMDIAPYTTALRKYRAKRLVKLYPSYNSDIVSDYAWTASMKPKTAPHQ